MRAMQGTHRARGSWNRHGGNLGGVQVNVASIQNHLTTLHCLQGTSTYMYILTTCIQQHVYNNNMYSRVGMQERTYLAFEVDPAAFLPHVSLNGLSGKNWFDKTSLEKSSAWPVILY